MRSHNLVLVHNCLHIGSQVFFVSILPTGDIIAIWHRESEVNFVKLCLKMCLLVVLHSAIFIFRPMFFFVQVHKSFSGVVHDLSTFLLELFLIKLMKLLLCILTRCVNHLDVSSAKSFFVLSWLILSATRFTWVGVRPILVRVSKLACLVEYNLLNSLFRLFIPLCFIHEICDNILIVLHLRVS